MAIDRGTGSESETRTRIALGIGLDSDTEATLGIDIDIDIAIDPSAEVSQSVCIDTSAGTGLESRSGLRHSRRGSGELGRGRGHGQTVRDRRGDRANNIRNSISRQGLSGPPLERSGSVFAEVREISMGLRAVPLAAKRSSLVTAHGVSECERVLTTDS